MTEIIHRGLYPKRAEELMPERIFSEEWEREQNPPSFLNYGVGLLQTLLSPAFAGSCDPLAPGIEPISQRDATVAATVIQWLGTNCGMEFLDRTQRRIAKERASDKRTNKNG